MLYRFYSGTYDLPISQLGEPRVSSRQIPKEEEEEEDGEKNPSISAEYTHTHTRYTRKKEITYIKVS